MGSRVKFGEFQIVASEGQVEIEVDSGKLDRIQDFPTPTSRDDVISFIRLIKNPE